jgi:predicted amidohydrolase YtcJ
MTSRLVYLATFALALAAGCSDESTTAVDPDTPVPTESGASSGPVVTSLSTSPDTSLASGAGEAASLVLHNGVIYTADDERTMATAVAITGETITAVGTDAEIDTLVGPDTRIVDLDGRLLVPGLIDAHVHAVGGAAEASKCTFADQPLTLEQMAPIVADCLEAESAAAGDWFEVVSVNPAGLAATAADLDVLISDRPAFFSAADGHVAWVNSAGLAAAEITAATPSPANGEIELDAIGQPTGRLLDSAIGLVTGIIPQQSPEEYAEATERSLAEFTELGITAVRDPSVNDDIIGIYESLLSRNALPIRVATSFTLVDMRLSPDELVDEVEEFVEAHPGAEGRLATDQVKVFGDGVIEAPTWTAAMLDPYLDDRGVPTENSGDLYYDPALFPEQVSALHRAGFSVHVHAVGDRAVRTALDAFEFANTADDDAIVPDQIVHLQLVDPLDYDRFAQNDVIAGFQADWAFRESYTVEALEPFMGAERYARIYPLRSVHDTGAVLAGGSDWPVSTFNPFQAMQRAVTRRDTALAEPFVADQAITIEQALDMYTRGAGASLPFDGLGIIAPGNPADIAVLSQNILAIDPYEVENTVSELTVVGGAVIYEAT